MSLSYFILQFCCIELPNGLLSEFSFPKTNVLGLRIKAHWPQLTALFLIQNALIIHNPITLSDLFIYLFIYLFIRLSAQGAYLIFGLSGWALIRGGRLFEAGRLLNFHHI